MEIRVLEYFLAVTREQSISGAAKSLHLSQPTLSRQLKDLEDELGKTLLIRGNRKITLTDEGMLLRKRAQEIVGLVRKTENDLSISDEAISGDIYIGTGETDAFRIIAKIAKQLQSECPAIHYHISSDDGVDVIEQLDKGLIDFGVLFEPCDLSKYDYIKIPAVDTWCVYMRKDSPLANKEFITPADINDKPLIISRQTKDSSDLFHWIEKKVADLNIVATYNLVYNASLLVDEGLGYALCLDKLINTSGDCSLISKPIEPKIEAGMYIVWKKYQIFSKASEKFMTTMLSLLQEKIS